MSEATIIPSVEKSTEETQTEVLKGAVISEEEIQKLGTKSLKEIVDLFEKLVDEGDIMEMNKQAEYIKATFYKVLKEEKIASGYMTMPDVEVSDNEEDGASVEELEEQQAEPLENENEESVNEISESEEVANPFIQIERAFKEIYAKYKKCRSQYFQKLEKERLENLEVRNRIIEDLKQLLEKSEDLNVTFPAFREIQNRWREAGPVPQANVKDIYDTYQHYVEKFYDYVKINNEFRDLDFKKNLEAKIALCEKAEALEQETNVVNAFAKLQKYHEEWKEYGPVAKEFREEIWERFKAATSRINKLHQQYFESLKVQQKENLAAKTLLCEKAEEIAARQKDDSSAWNIATKELEALQKEWRTIGFASKKDNQKIYDRFRASCDAFYEKKRIFYSEFKDQMTINLEKKIALCERAEAIKDSTDWKATAEALIALQKEWKEVGPVSRKKSDQVWARFRAACDYFFDRKEKSTMDPVQLENLNSKLDIIAQVEAYQGADETSAEDFNARWNSIGFVPFKEKEKIQKRFEEVMHEKFPEYKITSARAAARSNRGKSGRRGAAPVLTEREKLVQKYRKLESEIATYENNLGFFASSKNAEAFISSINSKIEKAKEELSSIAKKIEQIDNE